MECTTGLTGAALAEWGVEVFDLGGLLARLETLSDQRHRKGLRYSLAVVLLLVVLAKLSNEDHLMAIAEWATNREEQLRRALRLSWSRMPHHNTYRRILEGVVKPEELERVVGEYLGGLPGAGRSVLIAIDGKTLRGTIDSDNPRGEHLLAAYLPEEGIVLMQVAAGHKANEITAAPKLLGHLDLRDRVIVGDAIHTQRELSVQVLEGSGDYLWLVKENQPNLRTDIVELFGADPSTVLGGVVQNDFVSFHSVDKGHGRLESRRITVSSELKGYSDWPGLEQVFRLDRSRTALKSGHSTSETVYGVTSLSRNEASPERLLYLTRAYWGIENGLHGRRDTTFGEDRCRLTRGSAGRVLATINNLSIGLILHRGHTNVAQARRKYGANLTTMITLLAASSVT